FTALGQRIESDNNANVPLNPKTLDPLFGDLTNEIFVNEPYTKNVGLVAATLNLNFGWADLTSATAYLNTRTDQRLDVTLNLVDLPSSEEHTSELQSPYEIGCGLLREKKKEIDQNA